MAFPPDDSVVDVIADSALGHDVSPALLHLRQRNHQHTCEISASMFAVNSMSLALTRQPQAHTLSNLFATPNAVGASTTPFLACAFLSRANATIRIAQYDFEVAPLTADPTSDEVGGIFGEGFEEGMLGLALRDGSNGHGEVVVELSEFLQRGWALRERQCVQGIAGWRRRW